ncbi:ABC transporter permease [Streptomyces bambusae]|uniref:FtsX-like permease family protein n=1 Tax=Streptomyces bambusae TaxID=1550616 RepID=UPI001CFECF5F|nr:ABC transporter permease [Streptomyces bambusae]MCB5163389.1 ABC transporter permease [Streptomyces bambusae]
MNSWYHSWIAAIRIARRDAWRAKGRSLLVLAMIALPIVGVSGLSLTLRSAEPSTVQMLDRALGAADARLTGTSAGPLYQDPRADNFAPVGGYNDDWTPDKATPASAKAALPPGARLVEEVVSDAKLRTRHGLLNAAVSEFDPTDPLVKGLVTLDRGRFAQKAGEVAASTAFLEESGLYVGSKVVARGLDRPFTITGAYEMPGDLKTSALIAPAGSFHAPLGKALVAAGLSRPGTSTNNFVGIDGGFTWNMVQAANAKGFLVTSRSVVLDPPADSEVPYYRQENRSWQESALSRTADLAAAATIVGLAMLEICLLAGPAFAVGARRSRRQLGLVGANGGDRKHIRAIVLSGGLVIGTAAAVIGTALGIALTLGLRSVLEQYMGTRWPDFDVRPLELLGIGALAVLTGLLAAIAPAVTASRQSVLASLTGRRGVRKAGRVLPVIGLIAIALGTALALYGTTTGLGFSVVAAGSAVAELGIVALTPVLVGAFGRLGRLLPLSPRLALRDAVRNRARTAPAVAAVLAAVAGTVAVATYQESRDVEHRAAYTAELPAGTGKAMSQDSTDVREIPAVREAVSKELPVGVRADVDRIAVGRPDCDRYTGREGCGNVEVLVPKGQECPLWESEGGPESFTKAERKKFNDDWRCMSMGGWAQHEVAVADEKLLAVLGIEDPGAVRALKAGTPVAFERKAVKDGKVTLLKITDMERVDQARSKRQEPPGERRTYAVYEALDAKSWGVKLILPPATAKAAGYKTVPQGSYFTLERSPSSVERQRLDGAFDKMGADPEFYVENGYTSENSLILLALALFAGLVTIGAAGIATGLAQADAEADLKTLAAVGAPPRVRRTLSGFQCGVVAAMGVLLGSAAGILPAFGLRLNERREQMEWFREATDNGYAQGLQVPYVPVVVPWGTLGLLLVAVPVGAAVLAALVTRSSGAMARRAAA